MRCQTREWLGHSECNYETGSSFLNISGRWGDLDGKVIMKQIPSEFTIVSFPPYWKLFLSIWAVDRQGSSSSVLLYIPWQDLNTSYVICSFSSVHPQAGVILVEGWGGWTLLSVIFIMRLWLTYTCDTRYYSCVQPSENLIWRLLQVSSCSEHWNLQRNDGRRIQHIFSSIFVSMCFVLWCICLFRTNVKPV